MKRRVLLAGALAALMVLGMAAVVQAGGYDEYGYNYQANMFNGWYANYSRPETPVTYDDTKLSMKWNDAWMNEDKVRHDGYDSYIDSGAWLTNHMSGTTVDAKGKSKTWTYFCKIVAVNSDDTLVDGTWYGADGKEVGYEIWGQFAVVQEVINDPGTGEHGVAYKAARPALGNL